MKPEVYKLPFTLMGAEIFYESTRIHSRMSHRKLQLPLNSMGTATLETSARMKQEVLGME